MIYFEESIFSVLFKIFYFIYMTEFKHFSAERISIAPGKILWSCGVCEKEGKGKICTFILLIQIQAKSDILGGGGGRGSGFYDIEGNITLAPPPVFIYILITFEKYFNANSGKY